MFEPWTETSIDGLPVIVDHQRGSTGDCTVTDQQMPTFEIFGKESAAGRPTLSGRGLALAEHLALSWAVAAGRPTRGVNSLTGVRIRRRSH
ncbi:hypothetical protein [Amycolatopsis sp. MtRt-6]|uniref:hypothetical protein n=1 Tax=Amycolatopsis sp. MtRt-6 TaxID=2792782 RepID=UPI001A90B0E1|nr:hypothetical protein [Amycolatopsis sp. MtRt-6]